MPAEQNPPASPNPAARRPGRPDALPRSVAGSEDPRALPPWFRRAVVLVIVLVLTAQVLVWGFTALSGFWSTLVLAFFLGLAMEPLVNWLAARGVRRGMGTFIVLAGLLLSTVAFFTVFGGLLAAQLAELVRSLPDVLESILGWVNERFGTTLQPDRVLDELGIGTDTIAKVATDLGLGLLGFLGQAVGVVFDAFTVLLFGFYFAADGPRLRRTVASWMSPTKQRTFLTVWEISVQRTGGYVISRGVMALISAVFHGVALSAMGLPYWLPMALWVGLVSQFIPTIGTYLAGALPVIIALVDGSPVKALLVVVVVVVYQQIENYLVQPKVTRSTMEIHAAVAFASVIVGTTLFGALGALLAIPIVAIVQSVIVVYGRRYDLVAEFDDEADGSAGDGSGALDPAD